MKMLTFLRWQLFFVIIGAVLSSCAPATAPYAIPTEPAATEYVTDALPTPMPAKETVQEPSQVPAQVSGFMTVRFEMADDQPNGYFSLHFPETKKLEFRKMDGVWNKAGLIYPVTNPIDMGPLFKIEWSDPDFSSNSGRVNAYYGQPDGGNTFWPLDEYIDENVTITIRLSYVGCKESVEKWLVCEIFTDDGSLKYWLSPEMDKLIFVMKGNYRLEYETWMVDSLTKLGFTDVAAQIPDDIIPGQKKTINK